MQTAGIRSNLARASLPTMQAPERRRLIDGHDHRPCAVCVRAYQPSRTTPTSRTNNAPARAENVDSAAAQDGTRIPQDFPRGGGRARCCAPSSSFNTPAPWTALVPKPWIGGFCCHTTSLRQRSSYSLGLSLRWPSRITRRLDLGDGRGSCGQTAAYARASDAAWSSAEAQSTRRFAGRISNPFGAPFQVYVRFRHLPWVRGLQAGRKNVRCAPFMCVIVDTN